MELSKEEREAKIKELRVHVAKAYAEIANAEEIADEIGEGFYWELAYGMGGWYRPKGTSGFDRYQDWVDCFEEGQWQASSQSC